MTTEEVARFVCLAASRADVQADGWMDRWICGCRERNSHLSMTLYIFVCTISTADSLIRSSTGCRNIAGIYSEAHRQLTGYPVQQLIKWVSNYGRETKLTYVTYTFH